MLKDAINSQPLRILPDILAFGLGLGMAYFLKWNTTDLVWSLWLSSLVVGYLTILSTIGVCMYVAFHGIGKKEVEASKSWSDFLMVILVGFFFLGFFSIHFCGFHAGHSVFLRQFFPIEGMPVDGFGRAFMNPPLLWRLAFHYLMDPYGLFVVSVIIAERKHIFSPLINAIKSAHKGTAINDYVTLMIKNRKDENQSIQINPMARPYINVMRMHFLIFFFAFCHVLKLESFFVYAVVYAAYFFPWKELKLSNKANS